MHGLKQLIQSPTRVTCSTSTLTDHILTSSPSRVSQKGVINVGVSDYQLIFCTRKIFRIKTVGAHKHLNFHSLKHYTADYYKEALKQIDFPNYEHFGDVNEAYSNFFQKLMTVIDKITPYKSKRVKGNTQKWFDGEVLEKLNLRNKLFKKFKKSRLHIDKELYKKPKYDALKLTASKKDTFFEEKLSETIGKPKVLWESLKALGMPNKTVISNFNAIEENDTLTYDTPSISKIFKNFFSNLAKSLLIKLPSPPDKYSLQSVIRYYSSFMISDDFCLSHTSEEKVLKIMTNIEIFKAARVDKLSDRFLEDGANILVKPISTLYNLSISRGVFPNACKVAKLKPIFKKGKKTDHCNYKPISLLPSILKIIEKVDDDQTNAFLSDEDILYNYHSDFRGNHSTNLCLSFLTDKVLKEFEEGLLTGMILIDLQKAFDTIDHEILLQKLKAIKFSESTIKWFKSYLPERIFLVNIENKLSDFGKISCRVPQGSILGPLLFLIYINDMPQAVTSNLLLYADDSSILYQHKDIVQIEKRLNKDFENLCNWFVDNKLSIHFGEDKTKSILFASKRRVKNIRQLNIKLKT